VKKIYINEGDVLGIGYYQIPLCFIVDSQFKQWWNNFNNASTGEFNINTRNIA
jgi:hypothetical protein